MSNRQANTGAAILSLFFPGLGHMVHGRLLSGIIWFVLVLCGYMALVVPGVVLHIACIVRAARL